MVGTLTETRRAAHRSHTHIAKHRECLASAVRLALAFLPSQGASIHLVVSPLSAQFADSGALFLPINDQLSWKRCASCRCEPGWFGHASITQRPPSVE